MSSLVIVTGVLLALFQTANMVVASIYYYLFNDVVPSHLLSRFLALFRAVGTLAGFVFNRYVFGMAESHTRHIFISAALLYGVGFLLMCWRVKEGEYPAPAGARHRDRAPHLAQRGLSPLAAPSVGGNRGVGAIDQVVHQGRTSN